MVKPITVNTKAMTVDGKAVSGIGSFSQQELSQIMSSGIVDVYKDDTYVAQMSRQDYDEYNQVFETPVEDAAYELLMNHKDELLAKYPGSTVQGIIGFVLCKQLCDRK